MYVITGATGRTACAVANYLLDKGKPIRVIGRNPERLQPFVRKGAEPFVSEPGDATSEGFYRRESCLRDASA